MSTPYTGAALYASGVIYPGNAGTITDLTGSGFSTLIAWAMHVDASGNLSFNNTPIVTNGVYVGDASWPGFFAGVKGAGSSVTQLYFSIGGWAVGDFPHIKALLNTYGTGSSNPLYVNLQALKAAIPSIDGIDLDDETLYDQNTTVNFSCMLNALGFAVTFCPYSNMSFWTGCLSATNAQVPGCIVGFNLQCYAGGAGNDPATWIAGIAQAMGSAFPAAAFLSPGLAGGNGGDDPSSVESQFQQWQPDGITSGFIWNYDSLGNWSSGVCSPPGTSASYAAAVDTGLVPATPPTVRKAVGAA